MKDQELLDHMMCLDKGSLINIAKNLNVDHWKVRHKKLKTTKELINGILKLQRRRFEEYFGKKRNHFNERLRLNSLSKKKGKE